MPKKRFDLYKFITFILMPWISVVIITNFILLDSIRGQTRPKKFAESGVCTRERADDVPRLVSKPALEAHRWNG